MALRLAGVAVGAQYGLVEAIAGVLVAQVVATASVGVVGWIGVPTASRAPRPSRSAKMRREIVSFIAQSSAATGVLSLRGGLAPLLLGAVTSTTQAGIFKIAQAPQSGFQALSAPARMVLLTEQTREWERGRQSAVLAAGAPLQPDRRALSRARRRAAAALVDAAPDPCVYGSSWVDATNAARLFLLTAAVQLVVGWTKSFPVTIGRPKLRIWTHGLETLVVLPLVDRARVALGRDRRRRRVPRRACSCSRSCGRDLPAHPARGRAAAGGDRGDGGRGGDRGRGARAMRVLVVSGIWPPDVGGPASHAPDVARSCASRGHEVEVVTTAAAAPAPEDVSGALDLARRCRRASSTRGRRPRSRGARGGPTSSTRPACSGAAHPARRLARRPYVVKLTADPAFERARRRGMVGGDVDEFQRAGGGRRDARAARRARRRAAARGARLHAERLPARARGLVGRSGGARVGAAEPGAAAARAASARRAPRASSGSTGRRSRSRDG